MFLHRAFLKKNPDRLLAIGIDILKRRLKASDIVLHLARVSVEGTLLYSHNPKERTLDIYEQEHVDMVPNYVNDFYRSGKEKPETIKASNNRVLLIPLLTRHDEHLGVMEITFKNYRKLSKDEIEELEYYSEAFISIIDDYRKQKQHLGYMRDITGLVILLIMWTLFFVSLSLIYAYSPEHYNIIFFVILFFILASVAIVFEEHLYSLKGWGFEMGEFLRSLPYYIGVSAIVVTGVALVKWFGLFGIPRNLGGSFWVFQWTWRDIFYPISVPLQEMTARALPHTILRNVLKGWHKHITIVLISSLIFGFGHISFGFSMVVLTFLLGIILGTLYEVKRNFWGICLVHMIVGYLVMTGLGFDLLGLLH